MTNGQKLARALLACMGDKMTARAIASAGSEACRGQWLACETTDNAEGAIYWRNAYQTALDACAELDRPVKIKRGTR